jgi:cellulose synthase (UDP-forming)
MNPRALVVAPRVTPGPDLSVVASSTAVATGWSRVAWWAIALGWVAVNGSFWHWWLEQAGRGTPWLYWPQTIAFFYQATLLASFFFYFASRMRRPGERPAPAAQRVAMITLCVPSHESLDVIRRQLEALVRVEYPHDSWVLDEGGSIEVRRLAEQLGVRYFTRAGISRWNEPHPPFQRATKAGNVNAWLDHVAELGVEYDVFVQLDIDHCPSANYLDRVLGHFQNKEVGWVQAPSVCGNLDTWSARGLAEQDMLFHGPLQMGFYGATRTPFIIGSHTSYRTSAIREIGGFQPTRAEDHLDTVVLAAHGYEGVFVPEIIAVGAGPEDFATYLRQQFAWAHSMIQIFFQHTPGLLRHYKPRQALQFLICQSWYTLWALSLAILWAAPTIALLTHHPIAEVPLGRFAMYFLPIPLVSTLMWCWARPWFQPGGLRLSWRGVLLEIARWPVVLWALVNVLLNVKRSYMITPKGVGRAAGPRLLGVYGPYVFMTLAPLAALWSYLLTSGDDALRGYYGLALLSAAFGAALLVTALVIELRDLGNVVGRGRELVRARIYIVATLATVVLAIALTVSASWHPVIAGVR